MSADQTTLVQSVSLKLQEKMKSLPKLMIGNIELDFNPNEPNEELREKARIELRETPENVEEGLKVLQKLLKDQSELQVPLNKEHLQKFLRPCKWYPDSSFEMMKRFYKFRQTHPRYCDNLYPSNEYAILMSGILTPLPRRTENVRVFLLEGGKKWIPKEISLDQIFRGLILFLDAVLVEPISQIAGVRVILDMDGLTLSHVTYFTPSFAAAVVEFVQRCLPCRLKGIHVVNQPFIFNMVFAIFKPFLQEKLRKRIHFHGRDRTTLRNFIDPKALPKRLGGELDYSDEPIGEQLVQYLSAFEDEFKESSKYGYVSKT
ncbi:PREDICTED: alpha-tocopherol transfer protein-like [Ceratosolen solmsi marchali]|uniref:Alpha-tocopherol transfer protein-like n=1 Tax=Ceratosolen solmsi marchali TaxID=326594 RepID=A0AAJ6YVM9_9HYME|nr:PREDICTED: alpha-tocopherol transfer protein-like [Ceratosolen solmsi marchali]